MICGIKARREGVTTQCNNNGGNRGEEEEYSSVHFVIGGAMSHNEAHNSLYCTNERRGALLNTRPFGTVA